MSTASVEVDLARKRISLTMKLDAKPVAKGERGDNSYRPAGRGERAQPQRGGSAPQGPSAMAAAFAKLQSRK